MKTFLKRRIWLIILPILFLVFHYSIYTTEESFFYELHDGIIEFPLINNAVTPLDIDNLSLKEEVYPSYLHPFQPMEYHYTEKEGNEIVVIDRHPRFSILSTDVDTILGDPANYYDESQDGMFYRGNAVNDYPNALFFMVQYLIITSFLILLFREVYKPAKKPTI